MPSAGSVRSSPSDPFGTGLMIAGGYANGHPMGGSDKPSGAGKRGQGKGRSQGKPQGQSQGKPQGQGQQGQGQGKGKRPAKAGGPKFAAGGTGVNANVNGSPAAKKRAGGANKPKPRKQGGRGDDWQPSGASAHESRLGFLGGRGRNDR